RATAAAPPPAPPPPRGARRAAPPPPPGGAPAAEQHGARPRDGGADTLGGAGGGTRAHAFADDADVHRHGGGDGNTRHAMFGRMRRLTDEQRAIRDTTRDFVRKEIAPYAADWDRSAAVPLDTVRRAGGLGLFGVGVPSEWGGGGADFISYILATEELAYGDAGVCNMLSATNAFGWKLRDHGTPEQKARYLRPVAS